MDKWRCWLIFVLWVLLDPAANALAGPVYRCVQGDAVAYQDHHCADTASQQQLRLIEPDAVPMALTPKPTRSAPSVPARAARRGVRQAAPAVVLSHECRSRDGAVFYRHDRCPASIPGNDVRGTQPRGHGTAAVPVSGRTLPRRDACRRMRASSAGRQGSEHDDRVSSYERNLGRDPCRRY